MRQLLLGGRKAFVIEIRCITNFHLCFRLILGFCIFENGSVKPFPCFAWSVHFATPPGNVILYNLSDNQ